MIQIDRLIEEIDSNSDTLEIRRDSFIDISIEDYLIDQFMELNSYNKFNSWKQLLLYYKLSLFPEIIKIDNEYGKLIVDYYLSNIKRQYEIPDNITFEISDESGLQLTNIDFDGIEENVHDNNRLADEINHIHLKNCIVTGATLFNWDKMFFDIKNDLDILDPKIYKLTNEFVKYSILLNYITIPKKTTQFITGSECVEILDKGSNIKVDGINYVIKCHELLKGVYDLMSQKTFPVELDEYSQKYLRKVTSDFYHERWEWLFCREMYIKTLNSEQPNSIPLYKYLIEVFSMDYKQLNNYLHKLRIKWMSNEK